MAHPINILKILYKINHQNEDDTQLTLETMVLCLYATVYAGACVPGLQLGSELHSNLSDRERKTNHYLPPHGGTLQELKHCGLFNLISGY